MDELLGEKPSNKCKHAIESSTTSATIENVRENVETEVTEAQGAVEDEPQQQTTKRKRKAPVSVNVDAFMKKRAEKKQRRHDEKMTMAREKLEVLREKNEILRMLVACKMQQ
ncbi:hypothetical protein TcasGA2_TC011572 [Tribolium castaneum]|uniref:Uncharacterized protein n=1 Tax=Tribolium castaneum TaxID=7070 RepID=D6WID7_TRICA|nr:hypothetical protein TcasGA2_TC011572 [Tribolium castaneum]